MIKAEAYLDRIKKIDSVLRNKLTELNETGEAAEDIGGCNIGERVQSSRNLHRSSDAIDRYIDIEREIASLKRERMEIIKTIERLPSSEYDVIYKLYVQDYSMKEIAFVSKKSYDWVKRKKRWSLAFIQSILDGAS